MVLGMSWLKLQGKSSRLHFRRKHRKAAIGCGDYISGASNDDVQSTRTTIPIQLSVSWFLLLALSLGVD